MSPAATHLLTLTALAVFVAGGCRDTSPTSLSAQDTIAAVDPAAPAAVADVAVDVGGAPADDTKADRPDDVAGPPPSVVRGVAHIIAIGDVHGDLDAARDVLQALGVMDTDDHWIADDLVVVQVGDQLDRGDGERAIMDLFARLSAEARAAGGAFYPLLGNHEIMNVEFDFRYVTDGGWADFADVAYDDTDPLYAAYAAGERGRVAAFRPGGPFATRMAEQNVAMVVGRTAFVHGGLLPQHVALGLDAINRETQAWLRGEVAAEPSVLTSSDSPIWTRLYSDDDETDAAACATLRSVLDTLDADRMVVGHTVQYDGITSACDGLVWRIDVGLAAYYGGEWDALELDGDQLYIVDIE